MKKLVLQKVVTVVAVLALGSAWIANDALAHGGGGGGGGGLGGHGGGAFGGNGGGGDHIGAPFPGGRMVGDFHVDQSSGNGLRRGRGGEPFFYGNYGDDAYGFTCWKSQVVPTDAAWRLRQAENGECY